MFDPKIRLSKALYDKVKTAADALGCASVEEFVERVLENETERVLRETGKGKPSAAEVEDIANKLKGLGYLD